MNTHQPLDTPRSAASIFVTGFTILITVAVIYVLLASGSQLAQGVVAGILLMAFVALATYALRHVDD